MSRLLIILLAAIGTALAQTNPSATPGVEEQKVVLADARVHALQHESSLPDFVCTQTTRRFESASAHNWQPIDAIVERLTYFDHREVYKVLTLNGQPANIPHGRLNGASSSGEFGSLMKAIFLPETETEFEWYDWSTLRGKTTQVYAYRVRASQSKYHIAVPERSLDLWPLITDSSSSTTRTTSYTASLFTPMGFPRIFRSRMWRFRSTMITPELDRLTTYCRCSSNCPRVKAIVW